MQIAAGRGAELQKHLVNLDVHEISEIKRITNDKAEWLGFKDIKQHGWVSPTGPSLPEMIRRPVDSTKLPHYLHGAIAALTFGETNSIWYSIDWILPEKPQWLKRERYQTAFNVQSGVIVSTVKKDPEVIVAANAWDVEHDETWRVEDDWHDTTYLTYSAVSNYDYQRGRNRKLEKINEILFVVERRSETETLVDRVRFGQYLIKTPFAQAVIFTPQHSPASLDILLGSGEGQAVAMMLLRRRAEMGWREVGSIKIWEDMGSQACLLFSIVDGSPVAEHKKQEGHGGLEATQPLPAGRNASPASSLAARGIGVHARKAEYQCGADVDASGPINKIYAPSQGIIINVGNVPARTQQKIPTLKLATLDLWSDVTFVNWKQLCLRRRKNVDGLKCILFTILTEDETFNMLQTAVLPTRPTYWTRYKQAVELRPSDRGIFVLLDCEKSV
ncbi:hypothetical protein LTR78_004909 [Recurvomyces mirabilis]|uniref:Uncharacterized protein n=1 Tax=Recurvomyces mirabilis TaxID=574656 RepID=A0AAE0WP67_9PEZI|nr:hypothetical protein LTR78_004909 [Recurvomyces mirabilis]KAK5158079.1 hypothetical protein LTS14_004002 [Recurvomyces mirabilis]